MKNIRILFFFGLFLFYFLSSFTGTVLASINAAAFDQGDDDTWDKSGEITLDFYRWQTFKPGHTTLCRVDLYLDRSPSSTNDIKIWITTNDYPGDGEPSIGDILVNTSVPIGSIGNPAWYAWSFSDVAVTVDQTYYIVVYQGEGGLPRKCGWWVDDTPVYDRGVSSTGSGYDHNFKTYYNDAAPEFSNHLVILGLGIALIAVLLRKTAFKGI